MFNIHAQGEFWITSFWRFQYFHCVSKHNCFLTNTPLEMIILKYQPKLVLHDDQFHLHMYSEVSSEMSLRNLVSHRPFFLTSAHSHHGLLLPGYSPGLLVQPRSERLAVWVTAHPLYPPTLSYKGVLTALALLFGPQNTPQPPIWLSQAERGRAEETVGSRGDVDGLLLAMLCWYRLS